MQMHKTDNQEESLTLCVSWIPWEADAEVELEVQEVCGIEG